uniref:Uncharacterized protein n=1 Tax=Arcella intermedia TaxID=1963864 RepID=A0A6B2LMG4_9EUKA
MNIQFCDIAGQERFGSMTKIYYKGATVGLIVFDVNQPKTFSSIDKWAHDIRTKWSDPFPILLVGLRCLQQDPSESTSPEEPPSPTQVQEKVTALCLHDYFEVQDDGTGINKLLDGIVAMCLRMGE